ncbi:OmpA family protein [Croceitalea sp. P059]|uniref:OmpA family protein n=1 Tax=Croceitalea sp. P059 TaxID=3075601 RepID=UPI0028878BD1|nr:OmpA family protein [Croceitalea sp. P059]MDT0539392.1 OmpA family protein [Croceitalea sp. P059]
MKKIFFYSIVLIANLLFAQNTNTSAEKSFNSLWYVKAAKQFQAQVERGDDSKEALQKVGDAYYFNTDMKNAVKWYGQLFSNYEQVLAPAYIFRYIHALKGVGNYGMAKLLTKRYEEVLKEAEYDISTLESNKDQLEKLLKMQPQFYVSNLSINTKLADFGAAYYQNQIVFASSRDTMNLHTRIYKWNEQPYLNLFTADTISSGLDLKNVTAFSKTINSKYHEAIVAFSPDGKTMYFTRNNYTNKDLKRDDDGTNHLKLYKSKLVDNAWSTPIELPFNDLNYSVGQPALSPDGKKLYFVSDMPGSIGSTDIFVVDILADDTYGNPKNLGPTINTSGREMFPYVTEGKFYFSSDGHLGLGGLDVFESLQNESFSKPINLGKPLNSNLDDFAYVVNEQTQQGYFSSNRKGGKGDDDIYSFQRIEVPCTQSVFGQVTSQENNRPLSYSMVTIEDKSGKVLAETTSDNLGEYYFELNLPCEQIFLIKASKEGFENSESQFKTSIEPNFINEVPVGLKKLNPLIVREGGLLKIKIGMIYFDFDKHNIRYDASIELNKIVFLMKEYPNMIIKIESHTDSRGNDAYNERLSDRRAKATRDYIISNGIAANRIESAIGYGEKQLVNECNNSSECSNEKHNVNRRSEFIILRLE